MVLDNQLRDGKIQLTEPPSLLLLGKMLLGKLLLDMLNIVKSSAAESPQLLTFIRGFYRKPQAHIIAEIICLSL